MKWSIRLGEWFGIGVHLHLTFLLFLGWVALSSGSLISTLFVLALFGFVVLHEYGHALTARHFGIRTRQITLYPIGGIASLERMPESPRAQALVALAGPAVNFTLAALLTAVGWLFGVNVFAAPDLSGGGAMLGAMVQANLVLGLFNLLPALPMDGGRVLKAVLSARLGNRRATEVAAKVARVLAVAMGLFGLFAEPARPTLVMIAVFVWLVAGAEARLSTRTSGHSAGSSTEPRPPSSTQAKRYNAWPTNRYRSDAVGQPPASPAPQRVRVTVVRGPSGPVLRVERIHLS